MIEQSEVSRLPHGHQSLSIVTSRLINRLKDGKIGDMITDEELSKVAGVEITSTSKNAANLRSAIRNVQREYRLVWKRQFRAGYIKCCDALEVTNHCGKSIEQVARKSRYTVKTLLCADATKLEPRERDRHTNYIVVASLSASATSAAGQRIISKHGVVNPVNLLETIEALANK